MRQKLQLRTNAWIRFRFILLATLLFSSFQSYAELGQTDLDEIKKSPFFKNRYTMGMVWDCSRNPSDAEAGVEWELSSFKAPYDASKRGVSINFGDKFDRYVQFDIENWNLDPDYSYITDDSGNKLVISLKLYDADGTLVSTVSKYGAMQGLGKDAPGFFYEQEDFYGTLFTMDMKEYAREDKETYIPETGVVENLSELSLVSGNGSIKTDDDKGLIIETSDKYKEGESGDTKNFDGSIHAGEIESLTIGTATASTIDILIKETTVKTGGVTKITSNTTATLTLSGATDLGPVENNGILTLEKEETDEIPLTLGAEITNNRTFTDNTGLLTKVKGGASIEIEDMEKEFTIEKGGEVEVVASTDVTTGAILSYKWEKLDEKSVRGALSLRSVVSSNGKMTFNESGQYRCLVTSTNGNIVSILTVYVTIVVKDPPAVIGPIETDNGNGLIIETSDQYKERENGSSIQFNGTIHASEIESLTIGTTDASTINILVKETTVKSDGTNAVTTVTPAAKATLTLSGTNDLGLVENNGVLTFEKENGKTPTLGNTQMMNKGQFTDHTGLLTEVGGDAAIKMESTNIMNEQFTIEEGGSQEVVAEASSESNVPLSYQWQRQDETLDWVDMPSLRSTASPSGKMIFSEAGQYRCLMTSTNGNIVSTLTLYVTIHVTTTPPHIPTYYSVYLPEVEGVNLSYGSGSYVVNEGYNFSFTLTLKPGYEQSTPIVKANGSVIEASSSGLYRIHKVYEDQIVTIDGVVKDTPTAIDKLDGMNVKVWGTDGTLHVYTPQTIDIRIFNFAGKLIQQKGKACGENHFDLSKGTYIVVVGSETIKIAL